MGKHRCKPFIIIVYGNLWNSLSPAGDELLNACQVLTRLTIWLARFADNNTLHGLPPNIIRQKVK